MERNKRSSTDNRVNGTTLQEDQIEPFAKAELRRKDSSDFFERSEGSDFDNSLLSVNNIQHLDDEDDDDEDDDVVEDDLILGDEDELDETDEKEVAEVEIDEDFDEDDLDEDDLLLEADDEDDDEDDL